MNQDLTNKLKTKHPVLLEHIHYFECDDGWCDIIDTLCETISTSNCSIPDEPLQAFQIKEKFAGLRFYTNYTSDNADMLIALATRMSTRTCEVCGNPGHVVTSGYWIKTLCERHRDEMGYREMNSNSD
jgi:hypothetical protein